MTYEDIVIFFLMVFFFHKTFTDIHGLGHPKDLSITDEHNHKYKHKHKHHNHMEQM